MVSYADFHRMPPRRCAAMAQGLHAYLGIPDHIKTYLDNGAFYFLQRHGEVPLEDYEAFVEAARPDWWPIPRDFIPTPAMSSEDQRACLSRTMAVNLRYQRDGYVPVIHVGALIEDYITAFLADERLAAKPALGLGGIVPNLLRAPKALPYQDVLQGLRRIRGVFPDRHLHLFGVGGTATLHLVALLGIDSVDSSGWRNRAARGLVQLAGRGDRMVAELGNWRGRLPDDAEWELLATCPCPACSAFGLDGLKAGRLQGFCHRATHNLWTLITEARQIDEHLQDGTYTAWYEEHVNNTIYRPLIDAVLQQVGSPGGR